MKKIFNVDKNCIVIFYGKKKFNKINEQKEGKLVIKGSLILK